MVVGIGSEWRQDDSAGLLVARRLRALGPRHLRVEESWGDPVQLLAWMSQSSQLILVDAVQAAGAPGEILELSAADLESGLATSSHSLELSTVMALADAMALLTVPVSLFGIVGRRFDLGELPSPEVSAAAHKLARRLAFDRSLLCA